MLLLKLLLVPIMIGVISLAGKRWGPHVAGWLAGFPTIVMCILFFLALEHGPKFAATAATASLLAMCSTVVLCVVYSRACMRRGWVQSTLLALAAWLVVALSLIHLPVSPCIFLGIGCATILVALRLFPSVATTSTINARPSRDVALRMICGAALTVAVTESARVMGPSWSGLLAGFPVLLIILPIFFHRSHGAAFVVQFLRSAIAGFSSYVTLSFMLAVMLPHLGSAVSFPVAVTTALLTQWLTKKRPDTIARTT